MAPGIKTLDPYLQTFDGGVDGARGGGRAGVFAQHMPRLQRVAQFKCDATMGDGAIERKAKFALGLKPLRIEMIAGGVAQIVQHTEKVVPDEMLQHEPIVQGRAPADGGAALRLAPEPGDQRAHEQLLCQAHARVRRHFERAEFDQAEASGRTVGREQLVDANFGAVGVAGDVDEKVAKQTVDQPRARWGALARRRHHRECDFELIELVIACLVDTRSLAGRTDEQAGEQVGQRGMPLPIQNETLEQVGPTQEGAIGRGQSSQHNVIAAAGADVAAVNHEFVGAEPAQARFLVERLRELDRLAPIRGGMHVHLNHPGIGRHLDDVEARVGRRLIAFHVHRHIELSGGRFDGGEQLEIVLEPLERRHEHAQSPLACLDCERGSRGTTRR